MSELIEELLKEHRIISHIFKEARTLGVTSETGQRTLLSAKEFFLEHIKKEDEQLYPVLRRAAQDNSSLTRILNYFAKDMILTSETVISFFEKYSGDNSRLGFPKDFGRLSGILKHRIGKEESILYEEYQKIMELKLVK